jgi:hypothetical protein
MTKILTRFYLEDGAWAKLQYIAALMHKAPKDVAELIMLKGLGEADETKLAFDLTTLALLAKPKPKRGRK